MSAECPHFGRPLEFDGECTICSGADRKLAAEQAAQVRTFPAKFESTCYVCRTTIHVGDIIAWVPGERAVHDECTS